MKLKPLQKSLAHWAVLRRIEQVIAVNFQQWSCKVDTILESDCSRSIPLQRDLDFHVSQRDVLLVGTHPQPDIEATGEGRLQQFMWTKPSIASSIVLHGVRH